MAKEFSNDKSAAGVSLLDKVKIQAEVLVPIHRELVNTLGKSEADRLMRRALLAWAKSFAREISLNFSGTGIQKIRNSVVALASRGLQEVEFVKETDDELVFHMKGCRAADFYRAAGIPELGELFLCEMDFQATREIDPELELERPQTLMRGGDFCDFRIRRRKAVARSVGPSEESQPEKP
jgi:L-2-amino-thiazoline-4-carboxylic acid hydrolase